MKTDDAFVLALIDGTELIQKAERLCPDAGIRARLHRALLELAGATAEAHAKSVHVAWEELLQ